MKKDTQRWAHKNCANLQMDHHLFTAPHVKTLLDYEGESEDEKWYEFNFLPLYFPPRQFILLVWLMDIWMGWDRMYCYVISSEKKSLLVLCKRPKRKAKPGFFFQLLWILSLVYPNLVHQSQFREKSLSSIKALILVFPKHVIIKCQLEIFKREWSKAEVSDCLIRYDMITLMMKK